MKDKKELLILLFICLAMILSSISGIIACNRISNLEDEIEGLNEQIIYIEENM